MFNSIEEIITKLLKCNYLLNHKMAIPVYLADKINKPLLIEGPAGVGKTELGKQLAAATKRQFIRLQCYEGLDESKALYEWNYQKQLLCIESLKVKDSWEQIQKDIYTLDFLLPRPILKAFASDKKVVLLIDEIDKSDEEFESFLLEALSDFQVTIPEYDTIIANIKPLVIITSNNRRNLSDALKRRCLHLYIDYPDFDREKEIIKKKVPGINDKLNEKLVKFVQSLRQMDLRKYPSVSETIDWAKSLIILNIDELDKDSISNTLSVLLKYKSDIEKVEKRLSSMLTG